MRRFDAIHFDGRTSARRPVTATTEAGILRLAGEGVDLEVPLALIRVEPPVAGRRHLMRLPDGAQLQTEAADVVEEMFPSAPGSLRLRAAERGWWPSIASVLFIAATVGWTILYGLPMGSEWVARRLPDSAGREMGRQAMRVIDYSFCKPSALYSGRQGDLAAITFWKVIQGMPNRQEYQLQIRACPALGANALALPDATIVVTDELVLLAGDDEEIAAVLAHEVGHVVHRHPLRLAIQAAGLAAILTTVAADAVSITGLAVALPTLLLETGYSRAFEDEADEFALRRLGEIGIPASRFADILERLEKSHAQRTGAGRDDTGVGDYLSTHPTTEQRVERARQAQAATKRR